MNLVDRIRRRVHPEPVLPVEIIMDDVVGDRIVFHLSAMSWHRYYFTWRREEFCAIKDTPNTVFVARAADLAPRPISGVFCDAWSVEA